MYSVCDNVIQNFLRRKARKDIEFFLNGRTLALDKTRLVGADLIKWRGKPNLRAECIVTKPYLVLGVLRLQVCYKGSALLYGTTALVRVTKI